MRWMFILILGLLSQRAFAQSTQPASPQVKHVLIISIDGLRPDVLLRSDAPNIRKLMSRGSFTMWAKTTPQSITLPSHISMLTGVNPNAHGIEWNADIPLEKPVYPNWPTIFELAKRAGYTTGLSVGKSKFNTTLPPEFIDAKWITTEGSCEDAEVAAHAVEIIAKNQPDVMFVHFPNVDNVGHATGWGTPEQIQTIAAADACVGKVIAAVDSIQRTNSTLVILSADHGGAGRTHGPEDPRSRSIPWIAAGPGVRQNYDLTRFGKDYDVQTYDTFATACYVLGIKPPKRIEGKPIREMFEDADLIREPANRPRTPATQAH